MRMTHQDPMQYIGRTISVRGSFYRIEGMNDKNQVQVSNPVNQQKGLLIPELWDKCRLYPSHEEVAARYSRIIALLRDVCIQTQTEARATIIGHLMQGPFSYTSEAVAWMGGSANCIRHALRHRHRSGAHKQARSN